MSSTEGYILGYIRGCIDPAKHRAETKAVAPNSRIPAIYLELHSGVDIIKSVKPE